MYLVNDIGFERNKFEKINVLKILFLGYPIVGFVWFLIYLGHSDDKNGNAFFFIVMFPFMIGLLTLFIFLTLRTMKRWNKTIEQICVENDKIKATSFSILWMKSMEYSFSFNEVKIKKSIFEWYGKEKKEGITITIDKDINIYIVKEYFDEYEIILSELNDLGVKGKINEAY